MLSEPGFKATRKPFSIQIGAKLDELRYYLYANHESVRGYAEAYRNGERILESPERIVEQISVNQYWISTVFLGLNHNYYLEGPPPLVRDHSLRREGGKAGKK